jgi:hypothetical protein
LIKPPVSPPFERPSRVSSVSPPLDFARLETVALVTVLFEKRLNLLLEKLDVFRVELRRAHHRHLLICGVQHSQAGQPRHSQQEQVSRLHRGTVSGSGDDVLDHVAVIVREAEIAPL